MVDWTRISCLVLWLAIAIGCSHHNSPASGGAGSGSGGGGPDVLGPGPLAVNAPNPVVGAFDGGKGTSTVPARPMSRFPTCDAGVASDVTDSDAGASPYSSACLIDERHGVFVDATHGSDTTGDGSRDAPLKTLRAAVPQALSQRKHVYACLGVYEEPLLIGTDAANGLALFGGLSCTTFLPDASGAHTIVRTKGKGAALEIAETQQIVVERFDFENVALDGAAGTTYVGAFIQNAQKIVLRDVHLSAAAGESGVDGAAASGAATSGEAGTPGANACAANPNLGGKAVSTNGCFAQSMVTAGGSGGDGGLSAGNGGTGNWLGFPQGGQGESAAGWTCAPGMGGGMVVSPSYAGSVGASGTGARGFGALVGSGFVGFSGQPGGAGSPGYGGAGGGGAKAPLMCSGLSMPAGASGGGGGSGGCGGSGGKGGGPGGSSFALISIDSNVWIEGGVIAYGNGGRGGRGASGQAGGKGGLGGVGGKGTAAGKAGCDGTAGADGGNGGPGGGGNGGHAIGVLYLGRAPKLIDVSGQAQASANKGGAPGMGPAGIDLMLAPQVMGTEGVSAFEYQM